MRAAMALEDMVKRSSEKLLALLRDESQADAHGFVSELLTAAANERESALEEARRDADELLTQRVEEVRTEAEAQIATEVARAETLSAARGEGLDRLLAGIGRLDDASSLSQALDVLTDVAGQVAERAAVLTVAGEARLHGWAFAGFGDAIAAAEDVVPTFEEAGVIGRAVASVQAQDLHAVPDGDPMATPPAFANVPDGARAVAVPVLVGGEAIAVLYGDDAARESAAAWQTALQILARYAGRCLEAITATRTIQLACPTIPVDAAVTSPEISSSSTESANADQS